MGKLLEVTGPRGNAFGGEAPLIGQNETLVAVTATQPITPLFQLKELYKINLADERIARAKAGMPVSETASKVEKAYYELLVAQRQLAFSKAKAAETENKWLVASSATPVVSDSHDEELIETSNTLAIATTKVKELTAALNDMVGWPSDTELQLVPPDPRFENISLTEATDKAFAANPEVIEAEQNVVKARSASTLQKLAYVPTVAVMGGYDYQDRACNQDDRAEQKPREEPEESGQSDAEVAEGLSAQTEVEMREARAKIAKEDFYEKKKTTRQAGHSRG